MTIRYSAPGRINLIGEHTDYNLGWSLPIALPRRTVVTFEPSDADALTVRSDRVDGSVRIPLTTKPGEVTGWAAYVAGVVWALRYAGHPVSGGEMSISSEVEMGSGLSSSAALECAALGALEAAAGTLPPAIFRRAKHIVEEIARVKATVQALRAADLRVVGDLLTASHRSSQHLFENSTPELDFLVDTLVAAPHVHGARLTGGGFGGAVLALTSGAFDPAGAQALVDLYEKKFGARPDVLHCQTADGAEVVKT